MIARRTAGVPTVGTRAAPVGCAAVAISIDIEAFTDSIPPTRLDSADRLRSSGSVEDLEQCGGGVQAVVHDAGAVYLPWVGIVAQNFTGECECASPGVDDLCVHAVALALTAFDQDIRWSGAATPPSAGEAAATDAEPERAEYANAVRRLAPRQLTALVVEQAMNDPLFASVLLAEAGMLDEPDDDVLDDFEEMLREVAGVTGGRGWQISDVEAAGRRLAGEVEILCVRPATMDMLDLVETAIVVWDELCGHLIDAHYVRRIDPEEISEPLMECHRDLCERLDLEPAELAGRLSDLAGKCQHQPVNIDVHGGLVGGR